MNLPIRFLVTSTDVLHCWAVPSFGIKIDAVPGRLNKGVALVRREGVFYGQCSELCGVNHGFMPICLYVVCLLYTSPSPRDRTRSRMPSSA